MSERTPAAATQVAWDGAIRSPQHAPWSPPLLRWAGSKRRLVSELRNLTPSRYGKYIEPFAGSACLFFALAPQKALLADFNSELVTFYETLRQHPRLVARATHSLEQSRDAYYRVRSSNPDDLDAIQRAGRFAYLNRHCFNGLYRTNKKGAFNVPMGRKTGAVPTEAAFVRCSIALRRATLKHCDYLTALSDATEGDFAYLDPPYATSRSTYGEYGYGAFSATDLPAFITELQRLDALKVRLLVSYRIDPLLVKSFPSWAYRIISVRRDIAGTPRNRSRANELLLWNPSLACELAPASSPVELH